MQPLQPHERIIVALDVPTAVDAIRLAEKLKPHVGAFKIGLRLITKCGPTLVRSLVTLGKPVMYDAKFHDIENTVADAVAEAAELGVWGFTFHASGGRKMMEAGLARRGESNGLGVSVLTSLGMDGCLDIYRAQPDVQVLHLAVRLKEAGCQGIVCSPLELQALRSKPLFTSLITVVPGIRPAGTDANDQARSATPGFAVMHGADYLIIGRPIYGATDPVDACKRINDEIAAALEHDTEPAPPVAEGSLAP
ncbi:MAG: orotidine-5'-phosphate decarboxylase [Patescibacteria group bacterium]